VLALLVQLVQQEVKVLTVKMLMEFSLKTEQMVKMVALAEKVATAVRAVTLYMLPT
jgi:hypothetical protein